MKLMPHLLSTFFLFSIASMGNPIASHELTFKDNPHSSFRINQVGYYSTSPKLFIIPDSNKSTFFIIDTNNTRVYSGKLQYKGVWPQSGEKISTGDFTDFKIPGTFKVVIPSLGVSPTFIISKNPYDSVFKASLKSFYFQRTVINLLPEFAGKWAREAGHQDTSCILHSSTGKTGKMSSSGGWYDAGDYGKYIVNSGISVGTMLSLYERFPTLVTDHYTNIPESKNGHSDLLDEIKCNLDWMKTMQDSDGGVFFKLAGLKWPSFVQPSSDTMQRYIIGKSTTSTLCLAANMAQSARVYKTYDSTYAADCLIRAKNAWNWAVRNPAIPQPSEIGGSGAYSVEQHDWIDTTCAGPLYLAKGNKVYEDEFFWAAAELFLTTGDTTFRNYLTSKVPALEFIDVPTWWELRGMGVYSLLTVKNNLNSTIKKTLTNQLISLAEKHLAIIKGNPYRIPYECFFWGSNASFLNIAILFSYAYTLTKNNAYYNGILETTDYIFGKNATGYSFITGFGDISTKNIHHRPSVSDSIKDPVPGFVAGGPNVIKQDKTSGAPYQFTDPARSYTDDWRSFASNEVAINWNAPLVHILGYLVANQKK